MKPTGIYNLFLLQDDFASGVLSMEAQHQRIGKRPGLAVKVLQILYSNTDLFSDLPMHGFLNGFSRLNETGNSGVEVTSGIGILGKQDFFTACDEHNNRRRKTGIEHVSAIIALPGSVSFCVACRFPALTAKLMILIPIDDLFGPTQ